MTEKPHTSRDCPMRDMTSIGPPPGIAYYGHTRMHCLICGLWLLFKLNGGSAKIVSER